MKSKFLTSTLILLLAVTTLIAQNRPKSLSRLIKKLQKSGADTILIYQSGCDGCEIKHRPANCTCLANQGISDVSIIFKIKGQIYREEFTCCQESSLNKMNESLSIPFFLSLKDMLKKETAYYKAKMKARQFLPPILTDNGYEDIELIVPGNRYEVYLSSAQIGYDYKIWKQYFWIDDEMKLLDFVRKDMGIHITTSSTPID